ncbi:hypothetical protein PVAP13_6KG013775 [Panicum virgatum]|uniref:Uncharacterized protein n=1 Tax=Panicum virgatum TaxID=38727 RepID=A0A8T0R7N2_PANVG|nr:hypothetical protein PVAP13_6KG013775 [Panicum virgatum]
MVLDYSSARWSPTMHLQLPHPLVIIPAPYYWCHQPPMDDALIVFDQMGIKVILLCILSVWKAPTRRLQNCYKFSSFFGSSNNKMVPAGFMVLSVYLLIFYYSLFLEADCSPANAFILGDA